MAGLIKELLAGVVTVVLALMFYAALLVGGSLLAWLLVVGAWRWWFA